MDHGSVEAEVRAWFNEYVETFVRCAGSGSADAEPLLKYLHAPSSLATGDLFVVVRTREEVAGLLGGELARLAKSDYGGSTAIDPIIQVINRRSATIAVTWSRTTRSGVEFQRLQVSYWIARTDDGWRILGSAVHANASA
jgi:hypothetical protein